MAPMVNALDHRDGQDSNCTDGGDGKRQSGRLKSAFVRSFPFSVIASVPLFFAAILIHDFRYKSDVLLGTRAAAGLAMEWSSEAGNLVFVPKSANGAEWTPSFRSAQRGYYPLLAEVLDQSDLSYLGMLFANNRSASDEIKQIADMVQRVPKSEEEARQIVHEAAKRMVSLRDDFSQTSSHYQRRPILLNFESKAVADLRKAAEQEVQLLDDKVEELKREVHWVSPAEPIGHDFDGHSDQADKAIQLTTEACHLSRVSFVLIWAVYDSHRDQDLRDRFVMFQKQAADIAAALAESNALAGSSYTKARDVLAKYTLSMQRRLSMIECVEASCH